MKTYLKLLLLTFSSLLLFARCGGDAQKDDPTPSENLIKSKYQIKGLSDSFYKEYETYTHFDIDTTEDGGIRSYFFTDIINKDKISYTFYFEEPLQPGLYQEGIDNANFYGDIRFDNIFCLTDSGSLTIKTLKDNTMTASLDVVVSASRKKYYRITAETIIATNKGYIVPNK